MMFDDVQTIFGNQLTATNTPWVIAGVIFLVVWSMYWKGIALWKSARISHKKWFVAFLVINTFGILEIVYIRFIARKYSVESVEEK